MKPRTLALEPGALIWESLTLVWELWAPVVEPGTLSNETPDETPGPTPDPNRVVKVAPGEGKHPSNILKTKDWDTASFPYLYPDARNGLHEDRDVKLTDPNYFQQRILNYDRRFANSNSFLQQVLTWN